MKPFTPSNEDLQKLRDFEERYGPSERLREQVRLFGWSDLIAEQERRAHVAPPQES